MDRVPAGRQQANQMIWGLGFFMRVFIDTVPQASPTHLQLKTHRCDTVAVLEEVEDSGRMGSGELGIEG